MRRLTCRPASAAIVLLAAVVMGCQGGGGDGGGGVTPPAGGITVSLSNTSLSVTQGLTGTVATTVTRRNGFAGDVDLTVEGAPDGVTATLTPARISSGSTSGSLNVAVAATVAPGTYTLTIRGRAAGVSDHTVSLLLTVAAAGGYTLSVSPSAVNVQQGGATSATVTVERAGGFAGPVALTVSGAPTGLTVVPTPASLAGGSASLAITAATTVAAGTYTITLHGAASGLGERTATITVQVTATAGTSVTVKFCGEDIPIWFAAQSESGAWTQITGGAGNTYAFSVGSRGAVAAVMASSGSYQTTVVYASAAELVTLGQESAASCVSPSSGSKHLTGTVANVGAAQFASITLGDALATVEVGGPPTFALDNAPDAASDLIAVRQSLAATGLFSDKAIIRRGLNLSSGSAIPVLDFTAAEAFAPATAALTLTNLGSDSAAVLTGFITGSNTVAALSATFGTAQQNFAVFHANQLVPGDLHELTALAAPSSESTELRGIDTYFRVTAGQTLALGPSLATPTVSTTSAAAPQRLRAQFAVQSAYSKNSVADFSQSTGLFGPSREVIVYVTTAYLGGSPTTWDVAIPDMSAAGFNASWGLAAGTVSWSVMATNFATLQVVGGPPADGTQQVFASRSSASTSVGGLRASRRMSPFRVLPFWMSPLVRPARTRR